MVVSKHFHVRVVFGGGSVVAPGREYCVFCALTHLPRGTTASTAFGSAPGKAVGADRKLLKKLDQALVEELATSPKPEVTARSPLGPLTDSSTRVLLIRLISTLNASFPDYDFTNVKADNFVKEPDTRMVIQNINKALCDVMADTRGFNDQLWGAIHEVIKVPECQVYSYIPDLDEDPLSSGTLCVVPAWCACGRVFLTLFVVQMVVQLLFLQRYGEKDLVLHMCRQTW